MSITETEIIARCFAPLAARRAHSLWDDAATLPLPPLAADGARCLWTVSTDSAVEGMHLPHGATIAELTEKAIRRSLSDMAASGASSRTTARNTDEKIDAPFYLVLNTAAPLSLTEEALLSLSAHTTRCCRQFDIELLGGDTIFAGSPTWSTATLIGATRHALHRRGARIGWQLWVSGALGEAWLGWQGHDEFRSSYWRPEPQFEASSLLTQLAAENKDDFAVIDISDGLVADLKKILRASTYSSTQDPAHALSATLEWSALPLASPLAEFDENTQAQALSFGDDYRLLVATPPHYHERLRAAGLHWIGEVTEADDAADGGAPAAADDSAVQADTRASVTINGAPPNLEHTRLGGFEHVSAPLRTNP